MPVPLILNSKLALPRLLLLPLLLCLCVGTAMQHAAAQVGNGNSNRSNTAAISATGSGKGVQLVQRVDDVLFGVDPISLAILSNRYV